MVAGEAWLVGVVDLPCISIKLFGVNQSRVGRFCRIRVCVCVLVGVVCVCRWVAGGRI